MSDEEGLLRLLSAVRRRMRLLAGLEGTVTGLLAAGSAALLLALGTRLALDVPRLGFGVAATSVALLGAAALAGLAWAARPVDLQCCAVRIDRAVARATRGGGRDRGLPGAEPSAGRNGDRVLAAWAMLVPTQARPARAGAWIRAALADAWASTRGIAPAQVVPLAWPRRSLGALAVAALATLVASLPAPQAPARALAPRAKETSRGTPARERLQVGAAALAAARAEIEDLRRRAEELRDPTLARLASDLAATVEILTTSGDERARLTTELDRIANEASSGAGAGADLRRQLTSAGKALAEHERTAGIGDALLRRDAESARRALGRLADGIEGLEARGRQAVTRSLDEAAAAAFASLSPSGGSVPEDNGGTKGAPAPDEPRRFDRKPEGARREPPTGPRPVESGGSVPRAPERELRRLDRALDQTADRCREDPSACADSLRQAARDTEEQIREAERRGAHESLADAARELRQRMAQGWTAAEKGGTSESHFEQAAAGGSDPTKAGTGPAPSDSPVAGSRREGGAAPRQARGAATILGGQGAGSRERPGSQQSDEAMGEATSPVGGGHAEETALLGGAGPDRATTIETGATSGFRTPGYQRVFRDYTAAAEEALDATEVPPERRGLVRRYYQLIRPRR